MKNTGAANGGMLARRNWLQRLSGLCLGASAETAQSKTDPSRANTSAVLPHNVGVATYNIRDYGAKGDGKVLDTQALQHAIDEYNADGGGTVLVPAGDFLIGTVELKSKAFPACCLRRNSSGISRIDLSLLLAALPGVDLTLAGVLLHSACSASIFRLSYLWTFNTLRWIPSGLRSITF